MKPQKLTLCGWGPYKQEETVDFSQMQNGLFLISGPTGGGKTTIFDGITYGLFGEVSGSLREKGSLRSDFADRDTKTKVILEFSHQGKAYKIVRNPKYDRQKLRGEGVTTEAENGELFCEGELLAVGSVRVTETVEQLLGLTYHQFKQISMIAQGEFQQLLTASSKERTEIFRNIFQTRLYDVTRMLLVEEVKELTGRIGELKSRSEEILSMFQIDREDWQELSGKKNKNYRKLISIIEEEQQALAQEMKSLEQTAAAEEKNRRGYFTQIEEWKQKNKELQQYKEDLEKIRQLKERQEALKSQWTQAKPIYDQIPQRQNTLEAIRQQLKELEAAKALMEEYERQAAVVKKRQQQYLTLDSEAKEKKQLYERKEDQYRRASAGIMARELKEGVPCPVCGSVHHPEPAVLTETVADPQELKQLKQLYESAWEKMSQAQTEAAMAHGQLKQLEAALPSYSLEELKGQIELRRKEEVQLTAEIRRVEEGFRTLERELETTKALKKQKEEGLKEPKYLEEQDVAPLVLAEKEADRRRKEAETKKARETARYASHEKALKALQERLKAREELEKSYSTVRELGRAASGYNNRNLVLEQYVLSVYFDEMLKAANLRLLTMTNDRYELYRIPVSRDKRTKEGMELEVSDRYTGKRRSVKSLSGGEMFKAALSLALGISDVVQAYAGGIQVETLFVDEGFGALDSDSLNQAVGILTSLSGTNRMIGIISHVEELKERIERQILVDKTGAGSKIRQ